MDELQFAITKPLAKEILSAFQAAYDEGLLGDVNELVKAIMEKWPDLAEEFETGIK